MSVVHKKVVVEYSAEIPYDGRMYWLGKFKTEKDALEVCKEADEHLGKDFLKWYKDYCIKSGGFLTEKQEQVCNMHASGMRQIDIAKVLGCVPEVVSNTLSRAKKKINGELFISRKIRIDYSKYADRDMSDLTKGEKKAIGLKIKGMYDREIAEELGTSISVAASMLSNAVSKLEGTYQKDRLREYNTNYKREHRKKLTQEEREKMREYQREYQKMYKRKQREKKLKQE